MFPPAKRPESATSSRLSERRRKAVTDSEYKTPHDLLSDETGYSLGIFGIPEKGELLRLWKPEKFDLVSVHPETPDETIVVSNSETRDFSFWQGNRGVARRLFS
jgi:hypothetical protein